MSRPDTAFERTLNRHDSLESFSASFVSRVVRLHYVDPNRNWQTFLDREVEKVQTRSSQCLTSSNAVVRPLSSDTAFKMVCTSLRSAFASAFGIANRSSTLGAAPQLQNIIQRSRHRRLQDGAVAFSTSSPTFAKKKGKVMTDKRISKRASL